MGFEFLHMRMITICNAHLCIGSTFKSCATSQNLLTQRIFLFMISLVSWASLFLLSRLLRASSETLNASFMHREL